MEEGDAIIGWQFNESWYASYPESEHADNNKLVCSCGEDYCAVFYLLSKSFVVAIIIWVKLSVFFILQVTVIHSEVLILHVTTTNVLDVKVDVME